MVNKRVWNAVPGSSLKNDRMISVRFQGKPFNITVIQVYATSNTEEAEDKGEKERYTHLNAELQRIARRDKKAFLSDQCKVIEENNRMGKTRDLFKEIRDTSSVQLLSLVWLFATPWIAARQASLSITNSQSSLRDTTGTLKGRNSMELTEAENIKRWQE